MSRTIFNLREIDRVIAFDSPDEITYKMFFKNCHIDMNKICRIITTHGRFIFHPDPDVYVIGPDVYMIGNKSMIFTLYWSEYTRLHFSTLFEIILQIWGDYPSYNWYEINKVDEKGNILQTWNSMIKFMLDMYDYNDFSI
jgi:hypothetical protein